LSFTWRVLLGWRGFRMVLTVQRSLREAG
jgi:hypothetical protein